MSLDAVKLEYKTFLETTYKQYHRMKDNLVKASESQTKMIDVQIIQFNEWQQKVGKMVSPLVLVRVDVGIYVCV